MNTAQKQRYVAVIDRLLALEKEVNAIRLEAKALHEELDVRGLSIKDVSLSEYCNNDVASGFMLKVSDELVRIHHLQAIGEIKKQQI